MKFQKLFEKSPLFFQNLMVSIYNIKAYRKRYGKKYKFFFELYKNNSNLSLDKLDQIQQQKYTQFVQYTLEKSRFYRNLYKDIEQPELLENIATLPIVSKEDIRSNLNAIYTISKEEAIVSKTGGTTGKSLEVFFTEEDIQDRFGMLDAFRSGLGYKLGKRVAWFSGKSILTPKDVRKNRFWKMDYYYKVRYYSTYHIQDKTAKYYLENLMKFKPEFIVGFPSSLLDIAGYGVRNDIAFPEGIIKGIFPTAETVTDEMRDKLSTFFKTRVYNQYASSEGAPFIIECANGNLHIEKQSGVFEVLDDTNNPAMEGRLIFTSFTTHGTPLIRYDIGDDLALSAESCSCGNNNPLVKEIMGRHVDFIFSEEIGKINLGNLSNVLKDVKGVLKFQVVQNEIDSVDVYMVVDALKFDEKNKKEFMTNLRQRIGVKMRCKLHKVEDIPTEPSGKFRMIKNNVKHLVK